MDLDTIVQKARELGYEIEFDNDSSTIKTRRGNVKVEIDDGEGQARCFLFGNKKIEIYRYNRGRSKNYAGQLIHEREHFQIFPYDLISFGILFASAFAYSTYGVAQNSEGWLTPALWSLVNLAYSWKFFQLYSDTIIDIRRGLGLGKQASPSRIKKL